MLSRQAICNKYNTHSIQNTAIEQPSGPAHSSLTPLMKEAKRCKLRSPCRRNLIFEQLQQSKILVSFSYMGEADHLSEGHHVLHGNKKKSVKGTLIHYGTCRRACKVCRRPTPAFLTVANVNPFSCSTTWPPTWPAHKPRQYDFSRKPPIICRHLIVNPRPDAYVGNRDTDHKRLYTIEVCICITAEPKLYRHYSPMRCAATAAPAVSGAAHLSESARCARAARF